MKIYNDAKIKDVSAYKFLYAGDGVLREYFSLDKHQSGPPAEVPMQYIHDLFTQGCDILIVHSIVDGDTLSVEYSRVLSVRAYYEDEMSLQVSGLKIVYASENGIRSFLAGEVPVDGDSMSQ